MKVIDLCKQRKSEAFARKAAEHFNTNTSHFTYAEGEPKQGELLAIRWNDFTVLVVQLDETFEPECWPAVSILGTDLPPRTVPPTP